MRASVVAVTSIVLGMLLSDAPAADIKIMYPPPLRTALNDLFPQFERASGHKLTLTHESSWLLVERIRNGEMPDVAFLTARQADDLIKEGKLARRSLI
jgi:molybdate transport system substrate-binding protein